MASTTKTKAPDGSGKKLFSRKTVKTTGGSGVTTPPPQPTSSGGESKEEQWSDERVEWVGITYARDELPPFDADCPAQLRAANVTNEATDCCEAPVTAYNPTHCLWLAMAAALAYRTPAQVKHVVTRIWRWDVVEFFEDLETDTQGFGMYNDKAIIISFRGTVGKRDWMTNLDYDPTEPFPTLKGVKVHNGFNTALVSVFEKVRRFILQARVTNPTLPLYLGGHSLGGALANLLLAYLSMPSNISDQSSDQKPKDKKERKKTKPYRVVSDGEVERAKEGERNAKSGSEITIGGSPSTAAVGEKRGRFRSLIHRGGKAKEATPGDSDSDDGDVTTSPDVSAIGEGHPHHHHHSRSDVPHTDFRYDDDDDDERGGDLSRSAPIHTTTAVPLHTSAKPRSEPILPTENNNYKANAKKEKEKLKERIKAKEKEAKKERKAKKEREKERAKERAKEKTKLSPRENAIKGLKSASDDATKVLTKPTAAMMRDRESETKERGKDSPKLPALKRGKTASDLSLLMSSRQRAAAAAADEPDASNHAEDDLQSAAAVVSEAAAIDKATLQPSLSLRALLPLLPLPSLPDSPDPPVHSGGWHTARDRSKTADSLLEPPSVALSTDIGADKISSTKSIVTPQPAPFVPIHVNGVYTFGQPKVGNEDFVYALKRHTPCTAFYRITHNNDVVPSVPRKGYAHCGRRIFVSQDGLLIQGEGAAREVRELNRGGAGSIMRTKRGLTDHLVRAYVEHMVGHFQLNKPELLAADGCTSPRGKLRGLLEVEQTVLHAEDAGLPEDLEEFMAALQGFSVADAIHTDNLGKTKKTTVKEAKKRATESIKLIKQKEKALRRRSQNMDDIPSAPIFRLGHRRAKSMGTANGVIQ